MVSDENPNAPTASEILRRAASLMHERAEAATPGPWHQSIACSGTRVQGCAEVVPIIADHDAAHIASWHPAVAHAVAGFLGAIAHRQAAGSDLRWPHPEDVEWAEQIARAYLGEIS